MFTDMDDDQTRLALNNERLNLDNYFDTLNIEEHEYDKKRILSRKTKESEWNLLMWIQADNQEQLLKKWGFFKEAEGFAQEKAKYC